MRVIQYQRTEWLAEHIYTHTTNRQQNTQIQYPRHREKPLIINMTQATTTTVLKIQLLYGILHHHQQT